jgi:hypothetical protein
VIEARVRSWSAWSAGREDADAWRRWAAEPTPLERSGHPEARFLPPLIRRRCSPLSRIALTAAFECCGEQVRGRCASVFASRHGHINESVDLLDRLALRQPLSPTVFSHTVHNAEAGHFSLAASNGHGSSSIAAQSDTFGCGWLEAQALLEREPELPTLLVIADVPLESAFAGLVDEVEAAYGVALLLAASGAGERLGFAVEAASQARARPRWPDAVEFLRWLLSGEPRLRLGEGPRRFAWERRSLA